MRRPIRDCRPGPGSCGRRPAAGLEQPAAPEVAPGAGPMLDMWPVPGPRLGSGPEDWPAGAELPPDAEPALGHWTAPGAGYGPDGGPELADWPDPPGEIGHGNGFAADEWSGSAHRPEPAPDGWPGPDDGLRPGAMLGQGGWAVPDAGDGLQAGPGPGDWTTRDAGLAGPAEPHSAAWVVPDSRTDEPVLNLWPTPDPGPHDAEPAPGLAPAAEQTSEDEEPADGPTHRVESEFNVWQRPSPAAPPDAWPGGAAGRRPGGPGRMGPASRRAAGR